MATKKGRHKEVLYNILSECASLVKDEFWVQFYENLAVGKNTKGIYITNGIIHTSNKKSGFSYNITDKAPEIIIEELHHLLTTYTSICSKKDMVKKRKIVEEIENELNEYKNVKWSSIKRKNIKYALIIEYCLTLKKQLSLTWNATISAYKTVVNAFEFRTHNSKDVQYENGVILNINDIEFDGENIINNRFEQVDDDKNNIIEDEGIVLQKLFDTYINIMMKSIAK